jgi:osmotically inducible protein OsmC
MGRPAGQRHRDGTDGQRRSGRAARDLGVPERLTISATVTLDEEDGVPTIVSSHLDVTAGVPGLDQAAFDAVAAEASELCPVSRLFAGAKITVNAALEPAL